MPTRGAAQVPWRPAAVVAAAAATTILLLATTEVVPAPAGQDRSEITAEAVGEYLQDNPGVPLALPGSLPRDYRWLGPGFTNTDGHGMVVARSSTFGPDPLGGAPTVEVCTQVPDVDHCQRGASTIHRTLGNGVPVVVSFRGPEPSASELAWWRAVRLNATTTPAWLD